FVDFAPLPGAGEIVFLGIDTSNLYRPEAETAEDRTLVPMANLPKNTHVASPGWVMSHVVLLPNQAGQGTFILDTARVASTELATEVAARQLRAVVACWWLVDCIPSLSATAGTPARRSWLAWPTSRLRACCGSKVIASSTVQPRRVFPASWELVARMGTAFNAKTKIGRASCRERGEN